jgi:hypothetical protein
MRRPAFGVTAVGIALPPALGGARRRDYHDDCQQGDDYGPAARLTRLAVAPVPRPCLGNPRVEFFHPSNERVRRAPDPGGAGEQVL